MWYFIFFSLESLLFIFFEIFMGWYFKVRVDVDFFFIMVVIFVFGWLFKGEEFFYLDGLCVCVCFLFV